METLRADDPLAKKDTLFMDIYVRSVTPVKYIKVDIVLKRQNGYNTDS